jgi:hypothetical protein
LLLATRCSTAAENLFFVITFCSTGLSDIIFSLKYSH